MTNLSDLSITVKKLAWVIGLIILVAILVLLIVLRSSNQKKSPQLDLIDKPKLNNLSFKTDQIDTSNVKLPQSPTTLAIYQGYDHANLLSLSASLAQKLSFLNKPSNLHDVNLGDGLAYTSDTQALAIYKNDFSYQKYPAKQPSAPKSLTTDQLKNTLNTFFSNLGLPQNFSDAPQTTYYQSVGEFLTVTTDSKNATITNLKFHHEIAGAEVIMPNSEISASFNKQGELAELSYFDFQPGSKIVDYPIISAKEAVKTLTTSGAALIKVQSSNTYDILPNEFKLASAQKAYLAYYVTPDQSQIIQPIWAFETQVNLGKSQALAIYAVPAIDPKFFTQSPAPKP